MPSKPSVWFLTVGTALVAGGFGVEIMGFELEVAPNLAILAVVVGLICFALSYRSNQRAEDREQARVMKAAELKAKAMESGTDNTQFAKFVDKLMEDDE